MKGEVNFTTLENSHPVSSGVMVLYNFSSLTQRDTVWNNQLKVKTSDIK